MNYLVTGISHHTAGVAVREKVLGHWPKLEDLFLFLKAQSCLDEIMVVQTCNRFELYSVAENPEFASNVLYQTLAKPLELAGIQSNVLYQKQNQAAVAHFFSVASSLDSQMTGENQITAQIKKAFHQARKFATTGLYLNKLYDRALYVSKRVKNETDITKGHVSMGSASIDLIKHVFGDLRQKMVVSVGAGKMGHLVLNYLKDQGVGQVYIANRTLDRARDLETKDLGVAIATDELDDHLLKTDVLLLAAPLQMRGTADDYFIQLLRQRKNRALVVMDLCVPRALPESLEHLDNLYLFNVDDLADLARENTLARSTSCEQAQHIVLTESKIFCEDLLNIPRGTVSALGQKMELIRQNELEKTLAKMTHLSVADRIQLESFSKSLLKRVLHDPILHIKNKEPGLTQVLRKLFRLDDENEI